ncbi:MAG TPA: MMPL family transporter, partial [Gammaproteobacteria bacterium]|nr:MMPL family transporter [Gammaproteobacteria bacterium]
MGSIDRALAACARRVLRYRKLVIAFGAAASLLSAYYAATHLGLNTSTANMISAKLQWRQDFNDYRTSFPALDNNIVIVIDAPSEAAADAFSSALVERLDKRPDLYHSVFAARADPFFQRNGLLYSSVADLEKLDDRLTRAQPLLGLLRSGLDGAAVVDVVDKALEAQDSGAGESAGMQPLAASLYAELAGAVDAADQSQHNPIAWQRLMTGGTSNQTVARRTVLLQPVLRFDSMAPAAPAIKGLHALIGSLTAKQFPGVKASLTGNIAMQHEEMQSVQRGANFAGIASFILATFILYATLRSWKLLAISSVTLLAGLCGAGAFAALAVGKLNLLSAAFAVTYIGLGTDYIIHVCLRVRELMAQGRSRDDAIVETVAGIGSSLVISAVTTAVGFYAFIPTAFSGVSELGIISGTGMFISVFASLLFLPALLGQFLGEGDRNPRPAWLGTRGFKLLTARPAVVLLVTALIVAVTFGALPHVHFDSNPLHMRDPNSESVRALKELAADNQAALDDIDAVAPNHATALAWAAKLRRLNTVRSVTTVDSLVPDRQGDKMAVLEDIGLVMGPGFAQLQRTAPKAADL